MLGIAPFDDSDITVMLCKNNGLKWMSGCDLMQFLRRSISVESENDETSKLVEILPCTKYV